MRFFYRSLFGQVIVALVLGVIVGVAWPHFGEALKPFGDGFIKLIKMIIAPLVFCVVVHGICGSSDLKKPGFGDTHSDTSQYSHSEYDDLDELQFEESLPEQASTINLEIDYIIGLYNSP